MMMNQEAVLESRWQRLRYGVRALGVRNYRLYWVGQFVSITGTWMQTTAVAWLVLKLTGSPLALGTVTALQFLPVMLFSLLAGVMADRLPRYRVVVVAQTAALLVTALFAALVATGLIQLWQIYLLAFVQGLINALNQPTQQAFAVELVGREDRSSAVALNATLIHTSRIVGPALAGLMFEPFGVATILACNAVSFVAVLIGLLRMDTRAFYVQPKRDRVPVLEGLREGLAYSWRTPDVLLVMILMAALGTFGYNFTITLPLIAEFVLHTDAATYGLLTTALGVGSLAAALTSAYTRTFTTRRLLGAAVAFSLLLGAVSLSTSLVPTALLLVCLGFAGITFTTTSSTLLQLTVPDELRGRVTSIYFLLFLGSTPIGGLLVGATSEALGVQAALMLCAVLCGLGVLGAAAYRATHEPR